MLTPKTIGRYAVRRQLGAGGFAVVWLGRDSRLDDDVAIKVLADNMSQREDVRARFMEEARVLRRTKSHRVVEVYDIGELPDERPYFVMTYADQGSLADKLVAGPLAARIALEYGAEIASGVQDIHNAGVLHRDIKPSNVLFRSANDGSSRLMIADLGLSRDLDRGSKLTMAAGTEGYMAPEQAHNEFAITSRADIYGLGATVYHALTGGLPVRDGGTFVPPSVLRPGLPAGTDSVILRALARDPGQRWPTARAFADALHDLREQPANDSIAPTSRVHVPDHGSTTNADAKDVTAPTSGARTGEVATTQFVRNPFEIQPAVIPAAPGEPDTLPPTRRSRTRLGVLLVVLLTVLVLAVATALTRIPFDDQIAGAGQPPAGASSTSPAPPSPAQPPTALSSQIVPSSTPPAPQSSQPATPARPAAVTPTPAPTNASPLPGTLTRCAMVDGRDYFECFLFSRGNTGYALDFYAHNFDVVMWERKPDNDPYAWSQHWQFWWQDNANAYVVYNPRSGRCLSIDDDGGVGAHLHTMPCNPQSLNQQWQWTDTTSWILRSKLGTCIDVPRSEYFDGAAPFGYDCTGDANQRWLLRAW
jgi:serine/threonine protein kinase